MDPSTPLRSLPGIGPVRSRRLAEAGYETVGDLLAHLPARYEDRTTVLPVAGALERLRTEEEPLAVTVRGRLEAVRRIRLRRRGLSMVRARLADASGSLDVLWFNRPYLASSIDPETEYLLHGRLRPRRGRSRSRAAAGPAPSGPPELVNPSCEEAERALQGGRIVPVYPALGPLGPATVRRLLARALEGADFDAFPEPLPADLLERRGLPPLGPSLRRLHLPDAGDEGSRDADAERLNRRRSPAHRRLIYGELLEQQLALAELRRRRAARSKRHRYDDPRGTARARAAAREILPFRLTGDQRRALEEIAADLRRPEPMARLLQGDVGSGKTIVAVLALVLALENGLQGAFMAPTELLAEQHHRRLTRLLGERYRIGLVTGSVPGSGRGSGSGGEAVR
ncbi:MAG: DEAD/DEAH box helicase, partial [Acidobacteriota bacterium]